MNRKKSLFLFLIFALLFTSCVSATPEVHHSTSPETETESTASPEPQPAEKSGDIVILYTSDVHCGIDRGFGYAGLSEIRKALVRAGNEVILVDDGDSIQGEPIGNMTRGEAIIGLMNKVGYDVAIPGNHEFDYGTEQFFKLAEKANFPYVCCNLSFKGERCLEPYVIRELGGRSVAFVGVLTPETITSSSPRHFQDEDGNYVYEFCRDTSGEKLYEAVQDAVDQAREEGAEFVILMAHLGNDLSSSPWTYAEVVAHTSGINAVLDGHSHDTDQVEMKNKNGETVCRSACGTKLAAVGWCRIAKDGAVSTGLYTWPNDVSAPELLGIENEITAAVRNASDALGDTLNTVVAHSDVELTINDPVAVDTNGRPIRMIRRAETNLGDFCADAYREESGADIAFVNGGGIRTGIHAGDITLKDLYSVHPFGNALCVVEITGQRLADALEWAVRDLPNESGGFQQVSGISFEVHLSVDSPCEADEYGLFSGLKDGERRVKNILVGGEPIDLEKTYTLASHDYLLLNGGGGFNLFEGLPLLQNAVKLDYQVLIDYIASLGGIVSEAYEDPLGQGRIRIIE